MTVSTWPSVISPTRPVPSFPRLARRAEVGSAATSAVQCESIRVEDGNDGDLEGLRI